MIETMKIEQKYFKIRISLPLSDLKISKYKSYFEQ